MACVYLSLCLALSYVFVFVYLYFYLSLSLFLSVYLLEWQFIVFLSVNMSMYLRIDRSLRMYMIVGSPGIFSTVK